MAIASDTLKQQQDLYRQKNTYLEQFCEPVDPFDFYRDIFPEGSFERRGHYEDRRGNGIAVSLPPSGGKGNGIVLQLEGGGKAKRYTVTDELDVIQTLQGAPFAIISPISYYGNRRCGKNARYLYAMAFDLDGVGMPQLRDLLHQMRNEVIPSATYIVNSGTGLHLYYVLTEPIPMYPQNQKYLKEAKYALTRRIWNGFTSTIEVPQMQSVMQGFRVIGSCSKLGADYPVIAFQYGDRVSIEDLIDAIPDTLKEQSKVISLMKKGTLPLEVAMQKYPDWYDRRIVKGEPRGRWVVKRDLYDWWLRRIRSEIVVGHRFYGIMTLAIYAKKCNIDEDELRHDAYSLLDLYEGKTEDDTNHFTEDDIVCALEMYNEDYVTFPRHDIEKLSGIPVPPNKRNFRKQADHVRLMNFVREEINGNRNWRQGNGRPTGSADKHPRKPGSGRPAGSGSDQQRVLDYIQAHPEASVAMVAASLGVSRKTVHKWRSKEEAK